MVVSIKRYSYRVEDVGSKATTMKYVIGYKTSIDKMSEPFKKLVKEIVMDGYDSHASRKNEISVTESLDCPKKFVLNRLAYLMGVLDMFSDEYNWYIFRGKVWDKEMQKLSKHTQDKMMLVVEDEEAGRFLLTGTYDVYFEEYDKVIDIKSTSDKNIPYLPFDKHVKQIIFYATVAGFSKAGILYLTNLSPIEVDVDVTYGQEVIEEVVQRAKERMRALKRALKEGVLPSVTPLTAEDRVLCKFCPYYSACSKLKTIDDFKKYVYTLKEENGNGKANGKGQ